MKKPAHSLLAPLLLTLGACLFSSVCLAGRPLTVDDANVNDAGAGHVEAWYARQSGSSDNWTVAPAYGVADGIELATALSRDSTNHVSSAAVQAKFRWTESRKDGCNLGSVVGVAHNSAEGGTSPYLNGIVTCNSDSGSVHFNLGATRPSGASTLRTWGVAFERDFGAVTGHVEYFGQQEDHPTVQIGLRSEIVKNIQLDGTLGRTAGETVFSLGMKYQF